MSSWSIPPQPVEPVSDRARELADVMQATGAKVTESEETHNLTDLLVLQTVLNCPALDAIIHRVQAKLGRVPKTEPPRGR